uniref:SPRY domain-containing protein n=1 Tax=Meloidogyne floridensis TaxID=298350 RepID=A0A915NBN5_9BILA
MGDNEVFMGPRLIETGKVVRGSIMLTKIFVRVSNLLMLDIDVYKNDDEEVECLKEEILEEDLQKENNLKENNCNLKCKVKNVEERIKVLEVDMEKSDYSLELIKTKVDLQDQMLKQILFLQTNSQKRASEHTMAMLKMQKSSKLNQQKEILQQSKFSLKNIVALQKETIGTLEEKIGMVDDERKQLTERLNKAERELKVMTNKLANFSNLKAKFIKLENKWGYIAEHFFVDQKKIIHNNKFESKIGNVAINGGKVEYCASNSARELNNMIRVYGQNKFNKEAADPLFDSIFYFEIEFQNIEEVNQRGEMALIGIDSNKSTILTLSCCCLLPDKVTKSVNISVFGKVEKIRYPNMSWKSGDVCGVGLVYQKEDNVDQRPYAFFTLNGEIFGEMALIGIDSNKSTILTLSCCCLLPDKITKSVNISVLGKVEK